MARLPQHPAPHLTHSGRAAGYLAAWLCGSLALAAVLLAAQALFAYEVPLSSHSVREAYFLGQRNDQKTAEFFAPYKKPQPLPQSGPHVAEIALLTPYAQVDQPCRRPKTPPMARVPNIMAPTAPRIGTRQPRLMPNISANGTVAHNDLTVAT